MIYEAFEELTKDEVAELFLEKRLPYELIESIEQLDDVEEVVETEDGIQIVKDNPELSPELMTILAKTQVPVVPNDEGLLVMAEMEPETTDGNERLDIAMTDDQIELFAEAGSVLLGSDVNDWLELAKRGVKAGEFESEAEGLKRVKEASDLVEAIIQGRLRALGKVGEGKTIHCERCGAAGADKYTAAGGHTAYWCKNCADEMLGPNHG